MRVQINNLGRQSIPEFEKYLHGSVDFLGGSFDSLLTTNGHWLVPVAGIYVLWIAEAPRSGYVELTESRAQVLLDRDSHSGSFETGHHQP